MSWLASGLSKSVTGRITQIGDQLKDILTEGTEEVYDPENELKVVSEKLKENEKKLELLKMECARWEDETNELNQRCLTYEAQIEQKQNEFRQLIISKETLIAELRNQLSQMETSSHGYQKSAFMEEYEEVMPSSDLNDFIYLDKELKRLKEDNLYLKNENQELLSKIKLKNKQIEETKDKDNDRLLDEKKIEIESLKQEIYGLKKRLEMENDQHQQDLVNTQDSFQEKIKNLFAEKQIEIDQLKIENNDYKQEIDKFKTLNQSSNERSLEFIQQLEENLKEKENEIQNFRSQIKIYQNDLEKANELIVKLSNESKQASDIKIMDQANLVKELQEKKEKLESIVSQNESKYKQNASELSNKITFLEQELEINKSNFSNLSAIIIDLEQKCELLQNENNSQQNQLQSKENQIEELSKQLSETSLSGDQAESNDFKYLLEEKQNQIEALKLELKQHQQNLNHEKMVQLQEQKHEKQEIDKLMSENKDLKIKLDEKINETTSLGQQISDLNLSLNEFKSNDSALFNELKTKTEQFSNQIDSANEEISQLKEEKEQLNEQRKQFEFCLEEKSREISQLKLDLQKNIQHISAQAKAIEKLQEDLKAVEEKDEKSDELVLLKQQYNQIYNYLEQKNQESLSYYNEIQRLNSVISEINQELFNAKKLNENLSEQYETLLNGFQLEQKMVEDLNEHTSDLNSHLLSIKAETDQQKLEAKNHEKLAQLVEQLQNERDNLSLQLKEREEYYEKELVKKTSLLNSTLDEEEKKREKIKKELDRLKEHLVEMSESYTKEAIEAEDREKQLRMALNNAQNQLQQQGANLESSSKDLIQKIDELNQNNQVLERDKQSFSEKLKQTEENLNHQLKVTKNLELVLERLQNEKDGQHQLEMAKFHQEIKESKYKINQLQKENQNYQDQIKKLNETIEAVDTLEFELNDREQEIKKLIAQIETKDSMIDSLEKRFNEVQKLNDKYVEKDIIKNLVIGYIKVPQANEKKQVLKLMATLLDFSQTELEQAEQTSDSRWFGGLLAKSTPTKDSKNPSTDAPGKSFTELLIQYVDRESRPKPNLQFDLNKKTDNPVNDSLNSSTSSNLPSSESALQFFSTANSQNSQNLNLVNRAPNTISGISSPDVANSFLEQILK